MNDLGCGGEVVEGVHRCQGSQEQIGRFAMSAAASLILCTAVGILGCMSSDSSKTTAQPTLSKQTRNAPSEQAMADHVPFWDLSGEAKSWIYLAVDPNTSDAELKVLLWYIRDKVQSHQFQNLELSAAEATRVDRFSYGSVTIYRGKRWTSRKDREVPTTKDPSAAIYTWGNDSDRSSDDGSLFARQGHNVVLEKVFDSSDHWISSGMNAVGVTPAALDQRDARLAFAARESAKYGRSHLSLNAHVDGKVLVLQAPIFNTENNRIRMYKKFVIDYGSRLCVLGFTTIQMVPSKVDTTQSVGAGSAYTVPCAK